MRRFRALVVLGCLLAHAPLLVHAVVEQTGNLEGVVTDDGGIPLPSVSLSLTGDYLPGGRTLTSDEDGRFSARLLPPGTYSIRVAAKGYAELLYDRIVIHVGRTTVIPLRLQDLAVVEHVVVEAKRPLIDPVRTTSEANYDRRYLEDVKVTTTGRSFQSALLDTPGTAPGVLDNPQVRGSSATENVYLIDGVNSNDSSFQAWGSYLIFDSIEEVQFQTGAFPAEFGRATGGVANVVTKTGGDRFSGTFDTRYTGPALMGSGDHFDPDEEDQGRWFTEATLGGPVLREKLYFFVAGGYYLDEITPAGAPTTWESRRSSFLGKLNWQVNPSNKLILQYTVNPLTENNRDSSALVNPEATTKRTWDTYFLSARYQGLLRRGLIFEAQAAIYRSELDVVPQSGDWTTPCHFDLFTGQRSVNSCSLYFSERNRNEASASLIWSFGSGRQLHTLKFGASLQDVEFITNNNTPGGQQFQDAPDASGNPTHLIVYETNNSEGRNTGMLPSFYVQDEWRVHPRVTLNLGLRYDSYAYDNDLGVELYASSLWQPRLGVAWDVNGEARNVIKVTASRLGHPSNLYLPSYANSSGNYYEVYRNETIGGYFEGTGPVPADLNGDGVIEEMAFWYSFGGPTGMVFANDGDIDAVYVDEYTLSYDRALGRSAMAGVALVRRITMNAIEDRFDTEISNFVVDNLPGVNRRYHGVELRGSVQWKGLDARGSYTYGEAEGNVGGAEGVSLLGVTPEWDDPAEYSWRWGYLPSDTRHAFRLNGAWSLPVGFAVGFGYTYFSGFPYNVERRYSDFYVELEYVGGRGAQRIESYDQLDLGLTKNFRYRGVNFRLAATILNVFDDEAAIAVNEQEGFAGQPLDYQKPRRIELGFRVAF